MDNKEFSDREKKEFEENNARCDHDFQFTAVHHSGERYGFVCFHGICKKCFLTKTVGQGRYE